ncbi:hypothetical protein ACEQ8H_004059 [Pleosporales sp. CAS-2024a]
MASRWADSEADKAEELRRKKEKEEKKRAKLQKLQKPEAVAQQASPRTAKRRRLSAGDDNIDVPAPKEPVAERRLLRFDGGSWSSCRHTSNYQTLNAIEEGSYGWVSRAQDLTTNQVVALKKVKMDYAQDGFPITALREIAILQKARHANIVDLQEILAGDDATECVLVMEFVEHDLKTLQEDMPERFMVSEVKTLLRQLVSAVDFLHTNHIIHRDLKTSNILLSNRGVLKLADFGMARYMPPANAPLTQLVVTLWYRAPELLLGATTYSAEIDMWSIGCVFGELLVKEPLLQGKNEVDQLSHIFTLCGLPTEKSWPAFYRLPNAKSLKLPRAPSSPGFNRAKFPFLTASGTTLLQSLLSLNPEGRPTAKEVLQHEFFKEQPKPKPSEMFPTFPSKAGQEKRRRRTSPNAPKRGEKGGLGGGSVDFSGLFAGREDEERGGGFQLKMA